MNIVDDISPDIKTDPATDCVPVTKDDNADLPDGACRTLLVGTAGTANLVMGNGLERDNVPLQQGYNPLVVRRVKLGGTADDIHALY